MLCPKCNINLPSDSAFCPNCGCNIEKTQKQIIAEQEKENKTQITERVVIRKNKTNKILVALLVISIIACLSLGYCTFSLYNQIEENNNKISDYLNENESLKSKNNILKKQYDETFVARDTLSKLKMYDNWGYATENFHANTGIVYTKTYESQEIIKIIMNYSNATCEVNSSNPTVADVYWSDKTWYYGEAAEVYIEPKSQGVSVLTFTNDAYKSTFRVLVIVT